MRRKQQSHYLSYSEFSNSIALSPEKRQQVKVNVSILRAVCPEILSPMRSSYVHAVGVGTSEKQLTSEIIRSFERKKMRFFCIFEGRNGVSDSLTS